jgi:hypothetical protein
MTNPRPFLVATLAAAVAVPVLATQTASVPPQNRPFQTHIAAVHERRVTITKGGLASTLIVPVGMWIGMTSPKPTITGRRVEAHGNIELRLLAEQPDAPPTFTSDGPIILSVKDGTVLVEIIPKLTDAVAPPTSLGPPNAPR